MARSRGVHLEGASDPHGRGKGVTGNLRGLATPKPEGLISDPSLEDEMARCGETDPEISLEPRGQKGLPPP